MIYRLRLLAALSLILILTATACGSLPVKAHVQPVDAHFIFGVAADLRYFTGAGQYDSSQYFRGAMEKLAALGGSAFLIAPGDIDPPDQSRWTIDQVLGSSYPWYPAVGNHELPGAGQESTPGANLAWLAGLDHGVVNPGPSGCPNTTYSFDYQNSHFAVLNEYCDANGEAATDGDVSDHLYDWLAADLAAHRQAHTFVIGHAPAFPQPDADNGRLRHETDSLNQHPEHRDRFWNLLRQYRVTAYLCGHTHNYSAAWVNGVWQIDVGHARGLGDTGAPSTLVVIEVSGPIARYQTYRDDSAGGPYTLRHSGLLVTWWQHLPHMHR